MPRATSPASTARSTRSLVSSSTISTSPRLLSRAYSSAASSENEPRMPITPRRARSPMGDLRGEAGKLGGPLQGDVVHGVLEPSHAGVWQQLQGAPQRVPLGRGRLLTGRAEQHRAAYQRVQLGRPLVVEGVDHLHVVVEGE